jgi:hypothetical protein
MPDHPNFEDIFRPKKNYPYFAKAREYPFRHSATRFEMVNAAWLADASLLAYVREADWVIRCLKEKANLEAQCIGFEEKGTQYFIAHNNDFVLVSFRGTEVMEFEDMLTDAKWHMEPWGYGGQVHAGFKEAIAKSIGSGLFKSLDVLTAQSKRTVWFTGHSLGAALATLAADAYARTNGAYTFGSPRVGNKEFAEDFTVSAYRFVNNNDIVPRVPPPGLYSHVGNVFYINKDGLIEDNPTKLRMAEDGLKGSLSHVVKTAGYWGKGYFDSIISDQLHDHGPIFYAQHIWASV